MYGEATLAQGKVKASSDGACAVVGGNEFHNV